MRRLTLTSCLGLVAACASPGMPPGGPEDHAPPKLVSVNPDTNATNAKAGQVTFRFDEVVSERPSGAQSIDGLVILSPSDGAPRVRWRRSAIQVRPRRAFRPNTTYTATLLPGITDLRGNTAKVPFSTTFSTGSEFQHTKLDGVVFDWVSGKPAAKALVQAYQRADTTFAWLAQADSMGRFQLRGFPPGSYLVRAIEDANSNRGLDPREPWDTVGVAIADSGRIEMYAFVHDTIGPRINSVSVVDSVTLGVEFDKAIHPAVTVAPTQFVVFTTDSTPLPVVALPTDSTLEAEREARSRATADSGRARLGARDSALADSVRRAAQRDPTASRVPLPGQARNRAPIDTTPTPKPSRPSPLSRVNLRLGQPLKPGTTYRLRATGLLGLLGNARTSDRVFITPKPPPPPPPDSARRPAPPAQTAPPRRP